MQNIPSNSGGSAMARGQRYQARVTAWWAARILLQTPIGEIFDIPPITIAERISSETQDAIDDLRVNLSNGHLLFGQCKTALSLSSSLTGEWASVLSQFYRELQRPVSTATKRFFVLYYEQNNENLKRLSAVLERYRNLSQGTDFSEAAFNQTERNLTTNLENLLDQLQAQPNFENLSNCREELLRRTFIKQLPLEAGSPAYLEIVTSLQNVLLLDPSQVEQVLTSLHCLADDLLADRGSRDRITLRRMLDGRGVRLRGSINYREDFERLDQWSQTEINAHYNECRHKLVIGIQEAVIERPVVDAIVNSAHIESFLVVGDAGVGKTGCLLSAVDELRNEGYRIWYWAADSLPHNSPEEIGTHLGLRHQWNELFKEASSAGRTVMVIDGLDGLRDSNAQRAYRNLIRQALQLGIKIIASIRTFDLHYSPELKDIFASAFQPLNPDFYNPEFRRVKHFYIKDLTGPELLQALERLPQLLTILSNTPQLVPVIANLFSLDLLCKLISDGATNEVFSAIFTQAELFNRFWERRIDNNEINVEITESLTRLIEQMIHSLTLQVTAEQGLLTSPVRHTLFSAGLLRNPPSVPGRIQDPNLIEFTHHLMFDYVAERLYVRSRRRTLAQELAPLNSCGLFIRPSLRLFFLYLWHNGRHDFWEMLITLQQAEWTVFQKLPASLIVAQEATCREDLQPLLIGASTNNHEQNFWGQTLQEIISAAAFSKVPTLFSSGSGEWWLEFARDLINTSIPRLVYGGAHLLNLGFIRFDNLSPISKGLLHDGAVSMLKFHLDNEFVLHQNMKLAVKWVCRTFYLAPNASRTVIRRLITNQELERSGYTTAVEIAEELENITDPSFVVEIFEAIFSYADNDQSLTSISNSLIHNFTVSRTQEYHRSWWTLSRRFSSFLQAHPAQGTRALIGIFSHLHSQSQEERIFLTEYFFWENRRCILLRHRRDLWFSLINVGDDRENILASWKRFLEKLVETADAEQIWNDISNVLVAENQIPEIWNALLESGNQVPQFFASRLWTILTNKNILIGLETYEAAERCLTAFSQYLTNDQINEIETAILSISPQDYPNRNQETIEDYINGVKTRLLQWIPENTRGNLGQNFFINVGSEFLQSSLRQSDYSAPDSINTESLAGQSTNSELEELLESLSLSPVTPETLPELIASINRIDELMNVSGDSLDSSRRERIRSQIVHCFKKITSSDLELDNAVKAQAYSIFTEELAVPQITPTEQELIDFDRHPSGGINNYLEAGEGFIRLAVREEELSDEIKVILQLLVESPQRLVRFDLGQWMWMLLDKWEDFIWETLERWISELPQQAGTQGVLRGALRDKWFWWLRHRNQERAGLLLGNLTAAAKTAQASYILRICGMLYADLFIFLSDDSASNELTIVSQNIRENLSELGGILQVAIDTALPKEVNENITVENRDRAVGIIVEFLTQANIEIQTFSEEQNRIPPSERSPKAPEWLREIVNLYEHLARRIHLAAEPFNKPNDATETITPRMQINEWWEITEPIMDKLLDMPHPPFAYQLIEAIAEVIREDTHRALHWLRRITIANAPQGLTFEQVAADKTIEILEQVLADHASLPAGSEMRDDFIQTLEAYLQIGWERALQLSIRLEAMLR